MPRQKPINVDIDAPYALKRKFIRIALPGLAAITIMIGLFMGYGSTWLTHSVYLQISENRAGIIDRAMTDVAPQAWTALQKTTDPLALYKTEKGTVLLEGLRDELKELGLAHLKVYGDKGRLLYSSEEKQIGELDASDGYNKARAGERSLIIKKDEFGKDLYELYVRIPNNPNKTVVELYEPVSYLNDIVTRVVIPAILVPVAALILLGLTIGKLVSLAQRDIDYRTKIISEFRQRLQKLVSNEAVNSLRAATGKGAVQSKRVRTTILFSDIRGFTDFCEIETAENVVAFLNKSLGIVIDAVKAQGGDVDKMIGDAVLAHFQGDDAEQRALEAAINALQKIKGARHPRQIGIGIYTGSVVMGTIGASDRMDFTIIGDPVNTASRLCSAADKGEVVIDDASYLATNSTHGVLEAITVKGKQAPVKVRRIKI